MLLDELARGSTRHDHRRLPSSETSHDDDDDDDDDDDTAASPSQWMTETDLDAEHNEQRGSDHSQHLPYQVGVVVEESPIPSLSHYDALGHLYHTDSDAGSESSVASTHSSPEDNVNSRYWTTSSPQEGLSDMEYDDNDGSSAEEEEGDSPWWASPRSEHDDMIDSPSYNGNGGYSPELASPAIYPSLMPQSYPWHSPALRPESRAATERLHRSLELNSQRQRQMLHSARQQGQSRATSGNARYNAASAPFQSSFGM